MGLKNLMFIIFLIFGAYGLGIITMAWLMPDSPYNPPKPPEKRKN